ncbi:nitroreductase family protein [Oceanicoccus sp. KOV_DT_Chl]|uniref:nitroreductase family protein n=1 Tax=Oceanicoccus sp. KOV_DT_Chl TaxID=1904639 RepID=UPI000C7C6C73|nr:nitroreductase family protein [Oceanicoccus sp. KOV_DT_Chl]
MDALTLLHGRNSAPRLTEPAPEGAELASMFKAAFRAPDHSWLRPWRFLTLRGEARNSLGELLVTATQARRRAAGEAPLSAEEMVKLAAKPLRAPLIIIVIAAIKAHPKVPAVEQLISAGCAAHSLLLAAHAQGYAGVWRTGDNAYDDIVKDGLGIATTEELVGFVYLGSVDGNYKPLRELDPRDFVSEWP